MTCSLKWWNYIRLHYNVEMYLIKWYTARGTQRWPITINKVAVYTKRFSGDNKAYLEVLLFQCVSSVNSGRQEEGGVWVGYGGESSGGCRALYYIKVKDWLENFHSLTRSWPGLLNKENKQDPSVQGFHLHAKASFTEPLRQQFHHTSITYGRRCLNISMTMRLPSGTADLTGRQRETTGRIMVC